MDRTQILNTRQHNRCFWAGQINRYQATLASRDIGHSADNRHRQTLQLQARDFAQPIACAVAHQIEASGTGSLNILQTVGCGIEAAAYSDVVGFTGITKRTDARHIKNRCRQR